MSNQADSIDNHPIIRRYMLYYSKLKDTKFWYSLLTQNVQFFLLLSPFATISISRQLSILPHRNLYGDYVAPNSSKELMKIQNEVTLRDSKNFELIKSTGMPDGQKPYRAPIYENYLQVIKGLYKQGVLGFYKGNYWRFFFIMIPLRARITLDYYILDHFPNLHKISFLKDLFVFTFTDTICHPAFLVETRYVLQNRLPQFQVYTNFLKVRFRQFHEVWVGAYNHFFRNFLLISGMYIFKSTLFPENYTMCYLGGQIFSYPVLTAMRRLVCQTSEVPGMLPLRYLNLLHALALIKKEEGIFRGLYRGFSFHAIFSILWCELIFNSARVLHTKKRIKEDEMLFGNDPVFNEIKRRKFNEIKSI